MARKASTSSDKSDSNGAAARFLKIGINIEYLRGISSSGVRTFHDLEPFPYLIENQPGIRYNAPAVVAVIKSLQGELAVAELTKAAEAAEQFNPMLEEIETFLKANLPPEQVTLLDPFAERMVRIAENVVKAVREEIA